MIPGSLVSLLVLLIVVALVWWVVGQLTLPDPIPKIVRIVLVVGVVLFVVKFFAGELL